MGSDVGCSMKERGQIRHAKRLLVQVKNDARDENGNWFDGAHGVSVLCRWVRAVELVAAAEVFGFCQIGNWKRG